jgi:hypothetical protein
MAVSRVGEIRVAAPPRSGPRVATTLLLCLRVLLIPGEAGHVCARPGMAEPSARVRRPTVVPARQATDRDPGAWVAPLRHGVRT